MLAATPAFAADLPALRWGGDKNGGAPFIFEEDGKLVGFEVELADYFGRELGRKPVFVQNQWDDLRRSAEAAQSGARRRH